jgi:hypothetical protein
MTKGIPHLHEFLRKGIMRLTQAGSLIVSDLSTFCKCALLQALRRLLSANTPLDRFRGATFL